MAEPIMPEQPPMAPEKESGAEQVKEVAQAEKQPEQPMSQPTVVQPTIPASQTKQALPVEQKKSQTLEEIEDIMEEDLESVFAQLPPNKQREFKKAGEETALEIEGMMHKVKVKSKSVFKLLFAWLKIIPGVNKYFLKQEAKMKTDEIMHLKEEINKGSKNQI